MSNRAKLVLTGDTPSLLATFTKQASRHRKPAGEASEPAEDLGGLSVQAALEKPRYVQSSDGWYWHVPATNEAWGYFRTEEEAQQHFASSAKKDKDKKDKEKEEKEASMPEFDAELQKISEVDDRFPENPQGENKIGVQPPEINTTEESEFGGPTQMRHAAEDTDWGYAGSHEGPLKTRNVKEQAKAIIDSALERDVSLEDLKYAIRLREAAGRENGESLEMLETSAAKGDEVVPNKGETLQGVQKLHINTPEFDRSFEGNEGEALEGVQTPRVNTTQESEFGGPTQMKGASKDLA